MGHSSQDELDLVITTMAKTIVDNADYFAQLDSIAGDGDFGYSLRNGWEVVLADYDSWDLPTTGAALKKIGATLAVIEDTGHMIPLEAPQRLLDVIVPWLAAQTASRATA